VSTEPVVQIVGAGLAGSEAAWQVASRGVRVVLHEMRPVVPTAVHKTAGCAELVCSNSFRGDKLDNAVGLLKEEMRRFGSFVMAAADETRVPAGGALAVDRERFSALVTRWLRESPLIEVREGVVERLPSERPLIVATGPLTGDALAADIAARVGSDGLAYYDAIAPIVSADSIDWSKVFRASRWDKGESEQDRAAYVNVPLDEAGYRKFVADVRAARKVEPKSFEEVRYFEGCLPLEVMADRGEMTLAFGPMKPVGLIDPKTGRRPYAVLQLRCEDGAESAYNMVGFQTRMTFGEQKRVFGLIPGLEHAEYQRFGSVHRNTFVNSPVALNDGFELKMRPGVYLAGQISGVEGYVESAASGLCIGIMLARKLRGEAALPPPAVTALGALMGHLRRPHKDFQPSNVVWSMFPELDASHAQLRDKRLRREALVERALAALAGWIGPSAARTPEVSVEAER
jgi:methylenetetrahydrofolate--tRNA-(uracil-5-)-methyltransferase